MMLPLLLAAAAASAQVVSITSPAPLPDYGRACVANDMTREWEKISFALWLTDYTIPDSAPRTATLSYAGCSIMDEYMGEPIQPREVRFYVSEDGLVAVFATTSENGADGATHLTLVTRRGTSGFANSAQLGAWSHHKVFYKGVGIDKVGISDNRDGRAYTKNVFVIPTGAVVK